MSISDSLLSSSYFRRSEFACRCGCGMDTIDADLVHVLNRLRIRYDSPLIINSGCRCRAYNARIKGASSSQHLVGRAADINIVGVDPREIHQHLIITYTDRFGIGAYPHFTHIDTRTAGPARWEG